MTDRELLEFAAKAGGIKIEAWTVYGPYAGGLEGCIWDPLKDDGDALRLASKLQLSIGYVGIPVASIVWASNGIETATESLDSDKKLNRAIVKVAAAIGEKMP